MIDEEVLDTISSLPGKLPSTIALMEFGLVTQMRTRNLGTHPLRKHMLQGNIVMARHGTISLLKQPRSGSAGVTIAFLVTTINPS